MMTGSAPDVLVLGAGIVGAACAFALARDGARVLVLDGGDIGGGATAAGMGHVVVMDDSEVEFALTRYSRDLWLELGPALPAEAEFRRCGTVWVAADEEEFETVKRKYDWYAGRFVRTEVLDCAVVRELEPNLREGLAGGLLVPDDSALNASAVANWLLTQHGESVQFRRCAPVVGITAGAVALASGEMVQADEIVCALGCGSARLFPEVGIRARKGHLALTQRYPAFVRHQIVELGYLKSAHGRAAESIAFNVQPRASGQMLIGSSRQLGDETVEVDERLFSNMVRHAATFMPAIAELSIARVWTGFRPATVDNLPLIGPYASIRGVTLATGHEGLGITTSLATAELVASQIGKRPAQISPEPYLPSRVGTTHLV